MTFKMHFYHLLLKGFHRLPDGAKLYLRSYKQQEPEYYHLKKLIKPNSLVVDIGSNEGAYSYEMSRAVGRGGLVVAIEPIKDLAEKLRNACKQLRLPVIVENCALSSFAGESAFYIPTSDEGELRTGFSSLEKPSQSKYLVQNVKVRKLDELMAHRDRPVSFIKCDTEGHEREVFLGASQLLLEDRPILLIEIEGKYIRYSVDEQIQFFENMGYECYYLKNNQLIAKLPLNSDSFPDNPIEKSYQICAYNFMFFPKTK